MKKIILAALVAAPLCACDKAQTSDFDTVSAAVSAAGADAVVATGPMGDTIVKVPATKDMLAVYNQDKNAMFLSVVAINEEGNCLVNVINENEYRVFCGSVTDITPDAMWAVQVVKPVETPAEPAAEGNAEQPAADAAPAEAQADAPAETK